MERLYIMYYSDQWYKMLSYKLIAIFNIVLFLKDQGEKETVGEEDTSSNLTFSNASELVVEGSLDTKHIICPSPINGAIDWGLVGKGIALSMGQGSRLIHEFLTVIS